MSHEIMLKKSDIDHPVFFKTDLSTSNGVDIPENSRIVNLSDRFASCDQVPDKAVVESTSAILNMLIMCDMSFGIMSKTSPVKKKYIEEESKYDEFPPLHSEQEPPEKSKKKKKRSKSSKG
jgi:hypothetical protein